jgi:pilus assembly protein CpaB
MNRVRLLIALAAAVLLGTLASIFVYRTVKQATEVKMIQPSATKVVVAAVRLPLGTRLQEQQLRLIDWPASDPVPGMFTRVEDCLNRALITSVVENEAILETKLAPKEAGAGLPATIPEGMRAVSVAVNDVVAVAGFVVPGTMVDVLVTGSTAGQGGDSVTRTVLEDVRVLAAGQKVEQDKEGKPQTVPVITLLVTPEQANKLTMSSTEGKIQLALRNTMDAKMVNPPAVFRASLFGGGPAPQVARKRGNPAPQKNYTYVIEVIRGAKRETTAFPNP